ncbi:MAG: HAD family phosphatase [Thermomicrobium sp.]|nr:HAD family phosphatase [Thermomicrobium sp.]
MTAERAGILFDLDGVLIDSEEAHYEATRTAFRQLGLPELPVELYQQVMLGRPDREAIATALAALDVSSDRLAPALQRKAAIYRDLMRSGAVKLLPDGIGTVAAALQAGYPVAIVTGALAEEARWALRTAGLADSITTIVAAEHVARGKPHPEPYLVGCQRLGVSALRSVAVEDSPAGVDAARAAGLRVVAVARRPLPPLERAERIVTELAWETVKQLLSPD